MTNSKKAVYEQITTDIAGKSCQEQIDYLVDASHREIKDFGTTVVQEVGGFVSLAFFSRLHFPEVLRLPFGEHHDIFFNLLSPDERGKQKSVLAPRGSGKSITLATILPVHKMYYRYLCKELGFYEDRFILILSRAYGLAADRVKSIRRAIEGKPSLQWLRGKYVWGEKRSITRNRVLLMPESRGGKVRGLLYGAYRPSLIILDDLDDIEALRNPEIRANDEDWFNSDLLECGDEHTNFINVDTVKSQHGLSNQLRFNPAWESHFIQAIKEPSDLIHPSHENLWQEYRRIYVNTAVHPSTRQEVCDNFWERNKADMTKGVKEIWAEKWDYRQIREKSFAQGRAFILREYQNYAIDREKAIFDMENAIKFDRDDNSDACFLRNDGRAVHVEELSGATVYLDWAGIKDSLDNCFASVVTIVWEPVQGDGFDGIKTTGSYGYVWDCWLDRGSRKYQLEALAEAFTAVQAWLLPRQPKAKFKICVEDIIDTTGDRKENFRRHYNAIRKAKCIGQSLQFVRRAKNKEERIADLENPIANGWLAFANGLDKRFIEQLSEFPVGEFMDGADALEGAWSTPVVRLEDGRRRTAEERAKKATENLPLGHVTLPSRIGASRIGGRAWEYRGRLT